MKDLTPRKIVEYLDEYIVGQQNAKRSVAVALRNRWRSSRLPKEIAREVSPKNILLIGPTGVGKTEIARRIAALTRKSAMWAAMWNLWCATWRKKRCAL